MGNDNSIGLIDRHKYAQVSERKHLLLDNVVEVQHRESKERFLVKTISMVNDVDNEISRKLAQRQSLVDKRAGNNILCLHNYFVSEQNNICGKDIKATLYLEYIGRDLATILSERKLSNSLFSQRQVWAMLHQVTDCLVALNDYGFKNVQLSTHSVVRAKTFKVIDNLLCNQADPYLKLLHSASLLQDYCYYSPEQLEEASKHNINFVRTPKCDVFTLALITIQTILLQNLFCLYKYQHYTMDIPQLHHTIHSLRVSDGLKNVLLSMVVTNEDQRIGLMALKLMLNNSKQYAVIAQQPQNKNILANSISFAKVNEVEGYKKNNEGKKNSKGISRTPVNRMIRTNSNIQKKKVMDGYTKKQYTKINLHHNSFRQNDDKNVRISDKNVEASNAIFFKHLNKTLILNGNDNKQSSQETPASKLQQLKSTHGHNSPDEISNPSNDSSPIRKVQKLLSARQSYKFDPHYNPRINSQLDKYTDRASGRNNTLSNIVYHKQKTNSNNLSINNIQSHSNITNVLDDKMSGVVDDRIRDRHKFKNGAIYEGEMNVRGEFEGNGILRYPNGRTCYSGEWRANSFDGYGVLQNEWPQTTDVTNFYNFGDNPLQSWSRYEGCFKMDKKEGSGCLLFANGDSFTGTFKDDFVHGFGTFLHFYSLKEIKGEWNNNLLIS